MRLLSDRRGWIAAAAVVTGLLAMPAGSAVAQLDTPDVDGVTDGSVAPNLGGAGSLGEETPDVGGLGGGGVLGSLSGVNELADTSDVSPSSPAVNEARTKLFGKGYDKPGVVRGRAVANTTWLMSYGGNVILHDSTIEDQFTDTGENRNNNGFISLNDVIKAKPTAILQNHTHFDQQKHAPEIAARSGADLVTDLLGCLFTKETAIEKGINPADINCNMIRDKDGEVFFTPDSWAGGYPGIYSGQGLDLGILETTDYGEQGWPEDPIPGFDEQPMAVQLKHSPSFFSRPYPENLSGPNFDPTRSAEDIIEDYEGNPTEIARNIYDIYAPFDLEGSNVGWLTTYKDFSMFHHGSSGATNDLEPGAAKIRTSLQDLATDDDPVDVELGSLAEMTFLLNGNYFEDQKQYAGHIGAKKWFPVHHYNWYPHWLTNPAATYFPGMKETWADGRKEFDQFPEMCYLVENNYGTIWEFNANQWKGTQAGTVKPVTGPGCYTG